MPGKLSAKGRRSTRSRAYERRRRTRRAPRQQRGGELQALRSWLTVAGELHEKPPTSEQQGFGTVLRKPELTLTPGSGPTLEGYTPPFLSDIMTNTAVGIGEFMGGRRITSGAELTAAMQYLREKDKPFYSLIVGLEIALQKAYLGQVRGQTLPEPFPVVSLADTPTDKTPFVWIAYANLPDGTLEPRVPVLGSLDDLKESSVAPTA